MNREIKFRAWDIEGAQMITEPGFIQLSGSGKYSIFDEKSAEWLESHCEIMQFTGLKDKNGVDVYEGDVVKWLNPQTEIEGLSEVRYNGRLARFQMIDGEVWYGINPPKEIEVIGNIYEHPHLLKSSS